MPNIFQILLFKSISCHSKQLNLKLFTNHKQLETLQALGSTFLRRICSCCVQRHLPFCRFELFSPAPSECSRKVPSHLARLKNGPETQIFMSSNRNFFLLKLPQICLHFFLLAQKNVSFILEISNTFSRGKALAVLIIKNKSSPFFLQNVGKSFAPYHTCHKNLS